MLKLLCPDIYIENIYSLDLKYIKEKNINAMLVDLDNTLLPWNSDSVDDDLLNWVDNCKKQGISLCIISNNKYHRIRKCAKRLEIPSVNGFIKPFKQPFKKGIEILGSKPEQTAVIGDQLFTDIFGAKRMGLFAILVKPISKQELYWTRVMRKLERIALTRMERNRLISINR
ncbi:MAG: YqeG family HAD IIIA-type phosphatase [Tepidanaerobacteraceae bacterium]|jgi:HAD superfamily phosphatase (TIGR01668 family)|nr:YqeG family HAD IIIA-type phosphatase [Thermoanaerobacterales bacterium]